MEYKPQPIEATIRLTDRLHPDLRLKKRMTFKGIEEIDEYTKVMRQLKYKVELLSRQSERWEILATESMEPYAVSLPGHW